MSLRHAYPKLGLAQRRGLLLHCATALGTDGATVRRIIVDARAPPPPRAAEVEHEARRNGELREACALCELVESSLSASGSAGDVVVVLVSAAAGGVVAAGDCGALLLAAPALFGGWQEAGAVGSTMALRVQRAPAGLLASVADLSPTLAGIASALTGSKAAPGAGCADGGGGKDLSRYLLGLESPRRLLELL